MAIEDGRQSADAVGKSDGEKSSGAGARASAGGERGGVLSDAEDGQNLKIPAEGMAEREGDNGRAGELEQQPEKPNATKKEKEKKPEAPMVSLLRLFAMADAYDYFLMFFGSVGAVVHGAALPLFFLFMGKLFNEIGSGGSSLQINKYALAFVYMAVVTLFSSWAEVAFWMQTGDRQTSKMRSTYLEALLRQDVSYFDLHTGTGDFVSSVASDPLMVQDAISEKMGHFLHYIGTFVAGFAVGFGLQWRIALLTLAVIPMIAIAGGFYAVSISLSTTKASSSYTEAGGIAEQAISQVRTVYSFVGEARFAKAYGDALQKTLKLGARGGLAKGLGLGVTFCFLFLAWALLLWYGGILVRKGQVNGATTISTIFAVVIGSMSLGQAMPDIAVIAKGRAAAFKIYALIDHQPAINQPNSKAKTLESVEGRIELRDVEFTYPSRPDVMVFRKFSLEIPPGKVVAVVGSSGSGKSTVISLIERFYDPVSGVVSLDGHDLKTLDLKWLRSQIGLVNQEPALFATTIAENILYGKAGASEAEIEEVAKAANAHSFIEQLPMKYQTQVGERGLQLSGGQKQRVAIARAMLKNPKVLLLDEATSALDAGSERLVQEALERLMVGRTTVVVAHRLSTIQNADSIAVVQDGQIVEKGTHTDLMSTQDGSYSALVRLQDLAASNDAAGSMKRNSSGTNRISMDGQGSYRGETSKRSLSLKRGRSVRDSGAAEVGTNVSSLEASAGTKTKQRKGSLVRLIALSRSDAPFAVAGAVGSMFAGCINPAFALVLGEVLQIYYNPSNSYIKKEVRKYSLIFVALGVASPLIYTLQHYSLGIASERLVKRVRERMFGTILRNEIGWFDLDDNNSSQLAARLSADATTVKGAIGDRISILMQNMTLLVVSYGLSFVLQWKLTLVMAASFPVISMSAFAEHLFLAGFSGDLNKAYARATKVAGEAVSNIRTVAAFNAEQKIRDLFVFELNKAVRNSFLRGQIAGLGFGTAQALMFCGFALGLWYAGRLATRGEASFGDVAKVFLILIVCAFGAAEALALSPDFVKGGSAVQSVFEILDRETEIDPDDPHAEKVDKIQGNIQMKHITFAYPSRPDVIIFKNFNLSVPSGRSLAIVGSSGSGKSSVIALIERFYDPTSGQLLIDGKDIKEYNLKSLRQQIALVQQEPALFNCSVYENIENGRDGASEAEVIEAAKAANAHAFISALPDGYQTMVGERGIQLSGGQKQRVAIARAVLKDPAILLLDEATSALDAESEKVVQEALDRLMAGRTTIVVAHRLSTIRGADSIAVVEDGEILEQGSHSQLLSKDRGGYSRLMKLQNRGGSEPQSQSQSSEVSRT